MDDPSLLSLVAAIILLVAVYGFGKAFYSILWKPKWLQRKLRQQGIKGTTYKLLVGDTKSKEHQRLISQLWSKPINLNHRIVSRVDPLILNNVQKYGKISVFWNGTTPRLLISDPELFKEVLSNKQGVFEKPPLINPLLPILTKGVTELKGDKWTERRRLINPAFHLEKLKEMVPVFALSCYKMIEQWKKMNDREVDVWPELQKVSQDIISRAGFGSSYEEGKKIFELQRELMMLLVEAINVVYVPGLRFVPTKKNRRRKELVAEITSMIRDLVERKQNAISSGQFRVDDLLSLLLHSSEQNRDAGGTKNGGLTIEDVIEECKLFYIAGQETSATVLTWTMIVLAMHPDWQQKAREEVLQVCGTKTPDFEALTQLKIVTMILNEVLRLYPPGVAQYRHTYKETKIGDMRIPAGVDLVLSTMLIQRDPEFWSEDAEEFKPERFSEGVSKASKDHLAFYPFGWGPRICVGQNFAMLEVKTVLAIILQHFSFELSPSYAHAPYMFLILQPQYGAQIIIHQL